MSNCYKCSICGGLFEGYGNNARPVASGNCCDDCNRMFVIPARLAVYANVCDDEQEYNLAVHNAFYKDFCLENNKELSGVCNSLLYKNIPSNLFMLKDMFGLSDADISEYYHKEDAFLYYNIFEGICSVASIDLRILQDDVEEFLAEGNDFSLVYSTDKLFTKKLPMKISEIKFDGTEQSKQR